VTAVAHSPVDAPIDPAEAAMPATAFEIIQRAHAICDHAPARELTIELGNSELSKADHGRLLPPQDCLVTHATKILSAHRRAGELLAEMKQRGELSDLGLSKTCLVELGDETDEEIIPIKLGFTPAPDLVPVTDWQQVAADAWDAKGWKDAAVEYRKRGNACAGVRR
jgi:hypothetical protein